MCNLVGKRIVEGETYKRWLLVVDWRGKRERFEGESGKRRKNLYQEMGKRREGRGA